MILPASEGTALSCYAGWAVCAGLRACSVGSQDSGTWAPPRAGTLHPVLSS